MRSHRTRIPSPHSFPHRRSRHPPASWPLSAPADSGYHALRAVAAPHTRHGLQSSPRRYWNERAPTCASCSTNRSRLLGSRKMAPIASHSVEPSRTSPFDHLFLAQIAVSPSTPQVGQKWDRPHNIELSSAATTSQTHSVYRPNRPCQSEVKASTPTICWARRFSPVKGGARGRAAQRSGRILP